MRNRLLRITGYCLLFAIFLSFTKAASAEIRPSDNELVKSISSRLLTLTEPADPYLWPPVISIVDSEDVNAYAFADDAKGGKKQPKVVVYSGLLRKVVDGNADLLAFIIGHELSHVLLKHTLPGPKEINDSDILNTLWNRGNEFAADANGAKLALSAGYSWTKAKKGIIKMMDLGFDYTAFAGLSKDHPSWKERLAHLETDPVQKSLWESMAAFEDGNVFLAAEQYKAAETCFERVTREFDKCPEAKANLGYALLMQYCDNLDPEDLQKYDVGEIVCGGFFRRPQSLENIVRGVNSEIWYKAADALHSALLLKPKDPIILANMGIAYLVHPKGRDADNAIHYFTDALEELPKDNSVDSAVRLSIYINASVAYMAVGDQVKSTDLMDLADTLFDKQQTELVDFTPALHYNRARLLMAGSKEQGSKSVELWEKTLKETNPASIWWKIGYSAYTSQCSSLKTNPKSQKELIKLGEASWRPIVGINLSSNESISLTDPLDANIVKLGVTTSIPVVTGTNIKMWRSENAGIDILGAENVIAIRLFNSNSPKLILQHIGTGGATQEFYIGMAAYKVDETLGEYYTKGAWIDPDVYYRFYKEIGIGILIKQNKVSEILITPIPRRPMLGN